MAAIMNPSGSPASSTQKLLLKHWRTRTLLKILVVFIFLSKLRRILLRKTFIYSTNKLNFISMLLISLILWYVLEFLPNFLMMMLVILNLLIQSIHDGFRDIICYFCGFNPCSLVKFSYVFLVSLMCINYGTNYSTIFILKKPVRACHLMVELCTLTLNNFNIQDLYHCWCPSLNWWSYSLFSPHWCDPWGLPYECAPIVSVIERKIGVMDLDEVEILLLAHELRLSKFKKYSILVLVSLNLIHSAPKPTTSDDVSSVSTNFLPSHTLSHCREQDYHNFCGNKNNCGGHNGRGIGGCFPNFNIQCQICSKFGHTTLCYLYRFNQHYQPPISKGNSYNKHSWSITTNSYGPFPDNAWTRTPAPSW